MEVKVTQNTKSAKKLGKTEHLYVCHFSNGHTKVGRSCSPSLRIAAHIDRVSCLGVSLVKHHVVECVGDVLQAEAGLISWCKNLASAIHKHEWFVGVDFDSAVVEANKQSLVDYKKPAKNRSPANEELRRQAHEKFDAMFTPKRSEMEVSLITAKLIRDAIVLQMDEPEQDYQPNIELGGISFFELTTAIYVFNADREEVARLIHEAVTASGSSDLRSDLFCELRACALADAKSSGIEISKAA